MKWILVLILFTLGAWADWPESWSRLRTEQWVMLPALATGAVLFSQQTPRENGWHGGILVDDPFRDLIRGRSRAFRDGVGTLSDGLLLATAALPFLADAGGQIWLSEGSFGDAFHLGMIGLQSILLSAFLTTTFKYVGARERPFQRECVLDPIYSPDCGTADSRKSFFSGHAALAFTGAGLLCAVRGGQKAFWGEGVVCPAALMAASTVAVARIVADQHYLSDVFVGAAVGWLAGYTVPRWLHFRDKKENEFSWIVLPSPQHLLVHHSF